MAWLTSHSRIWIFQDKGSVHRQSLLLTCGTYNVEIQPDDVNLWVCGYCGKTVQNEWNCPHCNAPRKARLRNGTIDLVAMLPQDIFLDTLRDDFEIHILNGECCSPSEYIKENIIMLIKNCKVEHKYIPSVVARYSEEVCIVELHLNISGEISLRFEGKE